MRTIIRCGVLCAALTLVPATHAAPTYTIIFGNTIPGGTAVTRDVPFRRDSTYAIFATNGTSQYTGGGFAYPGHVGTFNSVDMTWFGFSGGSNYNTVVSAQATDFVITGPAGPSVSGALHFRATVAFSKAGGYAGNNAHGTGVEVHASANGIVANGILYSGNHSTSGTGLLSGLTGSFDLAFTISGTFPVGSPFPVYLLLRGYGQTYGNGGSVPNPGFVETDGGGRSGPYGGGGLRLEEVSGQVMTLPAGYTLHSTSWRVADNHFQTAVSVDPPDDPGAVRLAVRPNPSSGPAIVRFDHPRSGSVRVDILDVSGRSVRELANGWLPAGRNELRWDGRSDAGKALPSGIYWARVTDQGVVVTKLLVRVR